MIIKVVYPRQYLYLVSFKKFDETKLQLKYFYNTLKCTSGSEHNCVLYV